MRIKDIRILKINNLSTRIRAKAVLVLSDDGGNVLEISGFRVVEKKDGTLFVANPSESYEKNGERKYVDLVHISNAFRSEIQSEIIAKYQKGLSTASAS